MAYLNAKLSTKNEQPENQLFSLISQNLHNNMSNYTRVGRFCPCGQNLVVKTWFKPSCPKPPRWTKPDKTGQNLIVKLVNTYNTFIQVMAMFRPGIYQIMARLRPGYGQGLCKFRPCFALVMPR